MRSFKLLFTACIATLLFQVSATAQTTKTFIQEVGGLWGAGGHWSPPGVPTAQDDVIIPSDTALDVNVNAICKSIIVEADAEMDIDTNLTVGGGTFMAGSTVDWVTGTIFVTGASTGVLTVQGQLNVTSNLSKTLRGNTLRIENEMNVVNAVSGIGFNNGAKLQVAPSGVLNLEGELELFTTAFADGILENQGIINKTSGTDTLDWSISYVQDGGTFNLDFGSIRVSRPTTITGGLLNVSGNGFFEMTSSNSNVLSGMIMGQLDGPVIFNGNMVTANGSDAILNFSGAAGVEFIGGNLGRQGSASSAFVNQGLLTVKNTGSGQPPFMGSAAILRNESLIVFDESVEFFILNQFSTIENLNDGIVTIEDDTDILVNQGSFLNSGLIQKTGGAGVINFVALTNNEDGVFDIASGGVDFSSTFEGTGVITGVGSFETDGSDVVESIIAPGNNGPGTLTFENVIDFNATGNCVYQLELNGTAPDTDHDVFAINAPARLNGTFDIQLGFAPQLNDEFVVITANNIIECNLPTQTSGFFGGMEYTYDVVCNTNNVTLRVVDIALGVEENALASSKAFPNPTNGNFMVKLPNNISKINTTTTNILGQVVAFERFVNTDTLELNLPGSPGIYFVTLTTAEGVSETLKIVKK